MTTVQWWLKDKVIGKVRVRVRKAEQSVAFMAILHQRQHSSIHSIFITEKQNVSGGARLRGASRKRLCWHPHKSGCSQRHFNMSIPTECWMPTFTTPATTVTIISLHCWLGVLDAGYSCTSVCWSQVWALQKWLNRLRCHFGSRLVGRTRNHVPDRGPDSPWKGALCGRCTKTRHGLGNGCIQSSCLLHATNSIHWGHHAAAMQAKATITASTCYYYKCTDYSDTVAKMLQCINDWTHQELCCILSITNLLCKKAVWSFREVKCLAATIYWLVSRNALAGWLPG